MTGRELRFYVFTLSLVFLWGKWAGHFPYSYWVVFSPIWSVVLAGFIAGFVKGVFKGWNIGKKHGNSQNH